tara:strand:+ start:319 stop:732 length:414 start_codon:yes stop_codon:yes gene_type:complete
VKKTNILNKLRSSNLRPTKQRVEIAKFLFNREKTFHFTVESLGSQLAKKTSLKFALATIYNTVHAFKKAGHLSEVNLRGKNNTTYFDTNVSNHHHFFDSETSELIDINESEIKFEKIPKAPTGKSIKNLEVIINLKN